MRVQQWQLLAKSISWQRLADKTGKYWLGDLSLLFAEMQVKSASHGKLRQGIFKVGGQTKIMRGRHNLGLAHLCRHHDTNKRLHEAMHRMRQMLCAHAKASSGLHVQA